MKVHSVFYVFLLEYYRESIFLGRVPYRPPSIEIENHEEYEVEMVLDLQRRHGKLEYLVHWSGYDINERIWKQAKNLVNSPQKVHKFHQRYPDKPKICH